jgi:hypothetical protein
MRNACDIQSRIVEFAVGYRISKKGMVEIE